MNRTTPITHRSFQPNELSAPDGLHSQKIMQRRKDGLAANLQYKKYDIVRVDSADGTIAKFTSTTAADATRLAVAHTDYAPNAMLDPLPVTSNKYHKVTKLEGRWVLNMTGTVATDPAGQQRNVAFDTTDGVVKVQAGSTSPAVRVLGFAGDAIPGDTNPPVYVEWLPAATL